MSVVWHFIEFCLHLDTELPKLADSFGPWLYVIMFAVIFCETGLVVTPLLPGDSLLFAFGAVAAHDESRINLALSVGLLIAAAIAGDAVNYAIGALLGPKVFHYENSRLLNRKYLLRTHEFYERHGGKTIVLARFVPIVRTFAPFVAGIGKMGYVRFWQYNCVGGAAWVSIFLLGGYFFGNIPMIKTNFHIVMVAIIVISVMPMVLEWMAARRRAKQAIMPAIPGETTPERIEAEL
jgi:membrane-associated protein